MAKFKNGDICTYEYTNSTSKVVGRGEVCYVIQPKTGGGWGSEQLYAIEGFDARYVLTPRVVREVTVIPTEYGGFDWTFDHDHPKALAKFTKFSDGTTKVEVK